MVRLSSDIRDRAISSAKQWGHDNVDGRHVMLAIGEELELEDTPGPETVLAPRGDDLGNPGVDAEAEQLIARCTTEDESRAVFEELCKAIDVRGGDAESSDRQAEQTGATEQEPRSTTGAPGSFETERPVEDILRDLDDLVGLETVKASVQRLVHLHTMNLEREQHGLPTMPAGLNLVFTGSPGTGKTTVARLVSEIYRSLNLLPRGHLVETHRAELVAGYVGQTAIQVDRVVKSALGGVLFIDEAYALASPSQQDYGSEAIATLVKLMEDNRSSLAVIVAGYPAPMADFIQSNSGLRSRFQQYIEFPNYEAPDLMEIFFRLARRYQLDVSPEAQSRVQTVIANAPDNARAGNARFIRNLLEQSYSLMAERANADGVIEEHEMLVLQADDIPVLDGDDTESFGMYL